MKKNGGPAFPTSVYADKDPVNGGITIRDYFAAKAMYALIVKEGLMLSNRNSRGEETTYAETTQVLAYQIADAMINEREK